VANSVIEIVGFDPKLISACTFFYNLDLLESLTEIQGKIKSTNVKFVATEDNLID